MARSRSSRGEVRPRAEPPTQPPTEPETRSHAGHARRRAGRRQAVDVLYQADVMGRAPRAVLAEWRAAGKAISPYAEELVMGVDRGLGLRSRPRR